MDSKKLVFSPYLASSNIETTRGLCFFFFFFYVNETSSPLRDGTLPMTHCAQRNSRRGTAKKGWGGGAKGLEARWTEVPTLLKYRCLTIPPRHYCAARFEQAEGECIRSCERATCIRSWATAARSRDTSQANLPEKYSARDRVRIHETVDLCVLRDAIDNRPPRLWLCVYPSSCFTGVKLADKLYSLYTVKSICTLNNKILDTPKVFRKLFSLKKWIFQ